MRVYFLTTSDYKRKEVEDFLSTAPPAARAALELRVYSIQLPEILDSDIDRIVSEKALEAYQRIGLPCVAEHSGLVMDALPGLPGGLGQVIWNAIGERMCGFPGPGDSRAATARSVVGFCDGRRIRLFAGETRGQIAERARGEYRFNWDPVFIPDGSDRTYGEMGLEGKRATSPSIKAWKNFLDAVVNSKNAPAHPS